jgi:hypothetical protein
MTKKEKTKLINKILENTKKFEKEYYTKDKKTKKLSKNAQEIVNFLKMPSNNFGCNQTKVIKLMSILCGENITPFLPQTRNATLGKFTPFVAMVPLSNASGHNYQINKTTVSIGQGLYCIRNNGQVGNALNTYISEMRPATPSEIKKLPNVVLEKLKEYVLAL